MSRRFFDPQPFQVGNITELSDAASHHIGKVLRMRIDDAVTLFNGEGGEFYGHINAISKRSVSVSVNAFENINRAPNIAATVALPLIKGERMDYAIQKATELGARRFHLLQCERSDVRLNPERETKKLAHFQQVVISACEQCGLNLVPEVLGVSSLSDFLSNENPKLKLIAHPGMQALSSAAIRSTESLCLLTGPEGGFSHAELTLAQEKGFIPFALGERVLRAETAPAVLLAALWTMTNA